MPKLHFVLVHGAYHRAWCWHLVEKELRNAGCKSTALDLPSAGNDPVAENAFPLDVQIIKSAIEEASSEPDTLVVTVFHSYAGVPGSEALGMLSDATRVKVHHLIYLEAIVLQAGQSVTSMRTPKGAQKPRLAPWAAFCDDERFAYVPDPITHFYHDVKPELLQEALKHLGKHSISAFGNPLTHTGWDQFPGRRTFVWCDDDKAASKPTFEGFFTRRMTDEQRAGWAHVHIPGSHSPFLSRPVELATVFRQITGGSRNQGTRL